MAVTPAGGEGTLDTWRCPCQRGGRLDKTGVTPMLAWTRGRVNHGRRGVCEPVLEPRRRWEGSRKKAKVSNRTTGNPAVRDYRGASGNVAMVEMRSRLAYRKSESGNPPPTAGAPELYPNQPVVCWLNFRSSALPRLCQISDHTFMQREVAASSARQIYRLRCRRLSLSSEAPRQKRCPRLAWELPRRSWDCSAARGNRRALWTY